MGQPHRLLHRKKALQRNGKKTEQKNPPNQQPYRFISYIPNPTLLLLLLLC